MNVIQFRNSFDSQGPGVPGVRPAEAVARLQDFQQRYTQFEAKRKTLDSVQLLFGIVPTPFLELDKTGEVGWVYIVCSNVNRPPEILVCKSEYVGVLGTAGGSAGCNEHPAAMQEFVSLTPARPTLMVLK